MTELALLDVFAVCTECGASVPDWPHRIMPLEYPLLTWTDRDELALRVAGSCEVCDSPCLEIRVEDRSPRRAKAPATEPRGARDHAPSAAPPHVLVVDDDDFVRARLVRLLETKGYRVTAAENGRQALDVLAAMRELPSVVILDWWMPVMGGEAFLREIEGDPRLCSLKVAILTLNQDTAERHARAYIPKPFTTAVLLNALERAAR